MHSTSVVVENRSAKGRWGRPRRRGSRRAVSDVVATILLLALTVTLFSAIFAFITSFPPPQVQSSTQFQASEVLASNQTYVTAINIVHLAGPSVPGTGLIYLKSAINPSGAEFQTPYTVSSGLSGAPVWNLGQTWTVGFSSPNLPSSRDNISIYIVSAGTLLFSVILPGQSLFAPPTVVSTSISPAAPTVGQSFTVYATLAGVYTANSVFVNLAAVPGAPSTPQKMTQNAQGQWTYPVGIGVTTTAGTFYGFVNASSSSGQKAVGAVVITISTSGGTTNGPFSVGIILVPSPPNTGATESVQAVITYTGMLGTPEALNVSFTAISNPYVAGNRWTGWAPNGATIVGGSSVTVVSKTYWTLPANPTVGTAFTVYANATVATVGTVPGTMTFTPPYVTLSASSGSIGSSVTATGSNFVPLTAVSFYEGGVRATITGCTSSTSSTAASVVTTAAGGFVCTVQIAANTPATAATMLAIDPATGQNDTAAFAVNDWAISPSPASGLIGSSVTITGTFFAASSASVTVSLAGITLTPTSCSGGSSFSGQTITTSSSGGFTCVFTVPNNAPAGADTFTATSSTWGTTATTTFTVTAWTISLSTTSYAHGTAKNETITGVGFAGSSFVSIEFNGVVITPTGCLAGSGTLAGNTITTTAGGGFVCYYIIASSVGAGVYPFTAVDFTSGQSATTTVRLT